MRHWGPGGPRFAKEKPTMTMQQFVRWFILAPIALFGVSAVTFAVIGLVQFFAHIFG